MITRDKEPGGAVPQVEAVELQEWYVEILNILRNDGVITQTVHDNANLAIDRWVFKKEREDLHGGPEH